MPLAASCKQGVKPWGNQQNQKPAPFLGERHFSTCWSSLWTWSEDKSLSQRAEKSVVKPFKEQEKREKKNPAPPNFLEVPNLPHTMLVFTDIIGLAYGGVLGNYLVERACLSEIWEREGDGRRGLWVFGGGEDNWELKCHCPLARCTLGAASPGNSSSKLCENITADPRLAASKITETAECRASKKSYSPFPYL